MKTKLPFLLVVFSSLIVVCLGFGATTTDEEADLNAVRAAVRARLERLTNLLATYQVTSRYSQEEVTTAPENGHGSIRVGGTQVERKSFELLGELSGYESTLLPEESQGQSDRMLTMQQPTIAKFRKDRTEQLQISRDGKPIRGAIGGTSPLPRADLEVALGLRGVRSKSRLNGEAIQEMRLQRIDAEHVKLVAESGRVQDEWTLDSAAGYAPVSYKRVIDGANADFELTVDKMVTQNGLMLPQAATLTQKHWYGGKPTTLMTATIVAKEYRVNDPQNTPDRYEMKWPENTDVRDTRSGIGLRVKAGKTVLNDQHIYDRAINELATEGAASQPTNAMNKTTSPLNSSRTLTLLDGLAGSAAVVVMIAISLWRRRGPHGVKPR